MPPYFGKPGFADSYWGPARTVVDITPGPADAPAG